MNVTAEIKSNWKIHLITNFGEDALHLGLDLPIFEAYLLNGHVHVFAGCLSETRGQVLNKALDLYCQNGLVLAA